MARGDHGPKQAPAWVEAHDIAILIADRAATLKDADLTLFGQPTAEDATELVTAIRLALTFPAVRHAELQRADALLVRLRTRLELLGARGLVTGGWMRMISGRINRLGRMIGGWRAHLARAPPP